MKKIMLLILLIIKINPSYSQCLEHTSSRAAFTVQYFLTVNDPENPRDESGALNESPEFIEPVGDPSVCSELQKIIDSDFILRSLEEKLNTYPAVTRWQVKYYYKTENYYYIFWGDGPEYDGRPKMGPRSIFVVVKGDFSAYWKYYL